MSEATEIAIETAGQVGWIEYDYAVVRVVPRVHLCAFTNVGVVIHARRAGVLDARIELDRERLASRCPGLDLGLLESYLDAYMKVVAGGPDAAPVGLFPPSERFHWLTAPRSAVLQTSEVHPGRTRNLGAELDRLFEEQCR